MESEKPFSEEELNKTDKSIFFKSDSWGTLISHRNVTIDAIRCTKVINFLKLELPQGETYQMLLSYLISYKSYNRNYLQINIS
jgi:hypothetical protein